MDRFSWYQDEKSLTLVFYKNFALKEALKLNLNNKKLSICFNTSDDDEKYTYNFNLTSNIKNPSESDENMKVSITDKKMEIKLFKTEGGMWDNLESDDSKQENSNRITNSYDKFSDKNFNEELVVDENTEDSDEKFMNLLKEIYSKGDEETKRAMVKSFTTSSGERLSTNWNSVKDK
ncbi:SGS domain protein [Theileria parva strain Muguga]|uniref:SGS domain protein n=1 Tax=Theileria parva strain Muguga TaxID=333668 RepID=UPI001C621FE6|nr:SGS domain protein [Theileria parva strain Muguga]EAN31911.2 SGS domain protein [Theileria parva strain Muguga]